MSTSEINNLLKQVSDECQISELKLVTANGASTTDVFRALTPNSTTRELLELKTRITELCHRAENSVDPRVYGNPLPNQSVVTFKYGARAYVTDAYPDYVWRNGAWYKIVPELRFDRCISKEFLFVEPGGLFGNMQLSNHYIPDNSNMLDDMYYPVVVNGQRVFIREFWSNTGLCQDAFVYFPTAQVIRQLPNIPHNIPRHSSNLRRYFTIYEDPEFMKMLPEM